MRADIMSERHSGRDHNSHDCVMHASFPVHHAPSNGQSLYLYASEAPVR